MLKFDTAERIIEVEPEEIKGKGLNGATTLVVGSPGTANDLTVTDDFINPLHKDFQY
ncbi:hypothetical protein ACQKNO_24485 [Bacillus paramycoides]|uniref:hypothetical protein n=1 Tax=Bacillus paramycoides TaxID=2026194 RepID=UPI003CFCB24C